jgi:hypothetical protein
MVQFRVQKDYILCIYTANISREYCQAEATYRVTITNHNTLQSLHRLVDIMIGSCKVPK